MARSSARPAWFRDAGERYSGQELFFDLLFVLAVAQLSRVLDRDPTAGGALLLVLLFVPVWWAWTGFSFATDRFPSDDGPTRLMMLGAAAGAGVMALAIPDAAGSGAIAFGLGYAGVRAVLVLFYLRVGREQVRAAASARFSAAGFGLAAAVWTAALLLPPPARIAVQVVAIAGDLVVPALASRRRLLLQVDERHLPERFGAFVIIVIGETLTSTALLASEEGLDVDRSLVLVGAFALAAAFWWGFFDHGSWRRRYQALAGDRSGLLALVVCAYLHFPLVVGVTFAAAGTQIALGRTDGAIGTAAAAAVTGGAALYLLALDLMTWTLRVPRRESLALSRLVLIAVLAALLVVGRGLPPALFVLLTALVLVVHAGLAQLREIRTPAAH